MNAMKSDKERAGYLMDTVIIPILKNNTSWVPFYKFLKVLLNDGNPAVKVVAKELRSHLRPSMSPRYYGGVFYRQLCRLQHLYPWCNPKEHSSQTQPVMSQPPQAHQKQLPPCTGKAS